jgi:hypothetical protein
VDSNEDHSQKASGPHELLSSDGSLSGESKIGAALAKPAVCSARVSEIARC